MLDAVLEQGGGLDSPLHAGCGGGAFFIVRDDADESVHLWPVILRGDLNGKRVATCWVLTHLPCNETTIERSARGAGALTRDEGEGRWGDWELVEMCKGSDESGKA